MGVNAIVASPLQLTRTELLMRWLVDSHVLTSCSAAFGAFDESVMFQDEFHNITTLKRNFKGVFQVWCPAVLAVFSTMTVLVDPPPSYC
jgi:hypothetical protein